LPQVGPLLLVINIVIGWSLLLMSTIILLLMLAANIGSHWLLGFGWLGRSHHQQQYPTAGIQAAQSRVPQAVKACLNTGGKQQQVRWVVKVIQAGKVWAIR